MNHSDIGLAAMITGTNGVRSEDAIGGVSETVTEKVDRLKAWVSDHKVPAGIIAAALVGIGVYVASSD